MEGSDMTTDSSPCFICRQETDSFGPDNQSVGERQLSIIYLVNTLLKIPIETCCKFLSNFGNPEEWTTICRSCTSIVEEGRQLVNQIKELEQRHRAIGRQIRGQVKIKGEPGEQDAFGRATVAIRNELAILGASNDVDLSEESESSQSQNLMDFEPKIEIHEENSMDYEELGSKPSQDFEMDDDTNLAEKDLIVEEMTSDEEEFEVKVEQIEEDDPLGESLNHSLPNNLPNFPVFDDPTPSTSQRALQATQYGRKKKIIDDDDEFMPEVVIPKNKEKYFKPDGIKNDSKLKEAPKIKIPLPKEIEALGNAKQVTQQAVLSITANVIPVFHKCSVCHALFSTLNDASAHVCNKLKLTNFQLIAPAPTPEGVVQAKPQPPAAPNKPRRSRKVVARTSRTIKCDECTEVVENLANLEAHKRERHLSPDSLKCGGCMKSFPTIIQYTDHILHKTSKRNKVKVKVSPSLECTSAALKCELGVCGVGPRQVLRCSQAALELHNKIYHTVLLNVPFTCQLCQGSCPHSFSSEGELAEHMNSHHYPPSSKDAQLSCPHCPKVYTTKFYLKKHALDVHGKVLEIGESPKRGRKRKLESPSP